jgi:hypothetical protein
MAARLKVFTTSDGLTDYVVAASSRPKALAAWGVHQDLFKAGKAAETDDATLRAAALAQPGAVLRRPSGGRGSLAKLKVPPKPAPPAPSKAALRKVAVLEARLEALAGAAARAQAKIAAARRRLKVEAAESEASFGRDRAKLEGELSEARKALKA